MNDVLKSLVGRKVEIRSQAGSGDYRDDGVLESYDERWIVLQKSGGERIYFPITNVRLLKPME